jgi:hypothetical protein
MAPGRPPITWPVAEERHLASSSHQSGHATCFLAAGMRPHRLDQPCPWVEHYGLDQAEKLVGMFMLNGWDEKWARWAVRHTGGFVSACPRIEAPRQAHNQLIAGSHVLDWGRMAGQRADVADRDAFLASVAGELACWNEIQKARRRETTRSRAPEQRTEIRAHMAERRRKP